MQKKHLIGFLSLTLLSDPTLMGANTTIEFGNPCKEATAELIKLQKEIADFTLPNYPHYPYGKVDRDYNILDSKLKILHNLNYINQSYQAYLHELKTKKNKDASASEIEKNISAHTDELAKVSSIGNFLDFLKKGGHDISPFYQLEAKACNKNLRDKALQDKCINTLYQQRFNLENLAAHIFGSSTAESLEADLKNYKELLNQHLPDKSNGITPYNIALKFLSDLKSAKNPEDAFNNYLSSVALKDHDEYYKKAYVQHRYGNLSTLSQYLDVWDDDKKNEQQKNILGKEVLANYFKAQLSPVDRNTKDSTLKAEIMMQKASQDLKCLPEGSKINQLSSPVIQNCLIENIYTKTLNDLGCNSNNSPNPKKNHLALVMQQNHCIKKYSEMNSSFDKEIAKLEKEMSVIRPIYEKFENDNTIEEDDKHYNMRIDFAIKRHQLKNHCPQLSSTNTVREDCLKVDPKTEKAAGEMIKIADTVKFEDAEKLAFLKHQKQFLLPDEIDEQKAFLEHQKQFLLPDYDAPSNLPAKTDAQASVLNERIIKAQQAFAQAEIKLAQAGIQLNEAKQLLDGLINTNVVPNPVNAPLAPVAQPAPVIAQSTTIPAKPEVPMAPSSSAGQTQISTNEPPILNVPREELIEEGDVILDGDGKTVPQAQQVSPAAQQPIPSENASVVSEEEPSMISDPKTPVVPYEDSGSRLATATSDKPINLLSSADVAREGLPKELTEVQTLYTPMTDGNKPFIPKINGKTISELSKDYEYEPNPIPGAPPILRRKANFWKIATGGLKDSDIVQTPGRYLPFWASEGSGLNAGTVKRQAQYAEFMAQQEHWGKQIYDIQSMLNWQPDYVYGYGYVADGTFANKNYTWSDLSAHTQQYILDRGLYYPGMPK